MQLGGTLSRTFVRACVRVCVCADDVCVRASVCCDFVSTRGPSTHSVSPDWALAEFLQPLVLVFGHLDVIFQNVDVCTLSGID